MKIKSLIIGLSGMGLLATAAPIFSTSTNQITFADLQNIQSLDLGDNLIEIKSINKSCENLVSWQVASPVRVNGTPSGQKHVFNIESRVKVEEGFDNPAKDGKIERDDLFTYTRTDTQYASYHRYKSNHVKKNNHTSWGNAKKYQLNVIVPANTKEYKVQVVADVKIKNCLKGGSSGWTYSFAQAKLSQLSTHPQEILMPYIGFIDNNVYNYDEYDNLKIILQNDLFTAFNSIALVEQKPYLDGKLSSVITLSNNTIEAKEIPVYFWYGFFGGGYAGEGHGSHINCSEVTFSANHIE